MNKKKTGVHAPGHRISITLRIRIVHDHSATGYVAGDVKNVRGKALTHLIQSLFARATHSFVKRFLNTDRFRRARPCGIELLLAVVGVVAALFRAVDLHLLLAGEAALVPFLAEFEVVELADLDLRCLALCHGIRLRPRPTLFLGLDLALDHDLHGGREPVGLAARFAHQVAALAAHGVLLQVLRSGPALETLDLADGLLDDRERHQPHPVGVAVERLPASDTGHLLELRLLGTLNILLLGRHGILQKIPPYPAGQGK